MNFQSRNIPPELLSAVDCELEPGERIEWLGVPIPRFLTRASTGTFMFGIVWTGFATFWISAAWFKSNSLNTSLFGVPFLLIGFAFLSAPIFTYRKFLKTVYAITDKRALVLTVGRSTNVRSYMPQELRGIYRKDRRDGTGDVVVQRREWHDSDGERQWEELGFLHLDNPREIELMLRRLAAKGPASDGYKSIRKG